MHINGNSGTSPCGQVILLNEKHVLKICRCDSAIQEILAIVHKYVQPSCGAYLHAINRDSYIQIGINLCLCDVFNIDYLIQI